MPLAVRSGYMRILGAIAVGSAILGLAAHACSSRSSSKRPPRPPDIVVQIDLASEIGDVSPMLFGMNMGWEDLASRTVLGGELVRDRSFRLQGTPEEVWLEIPGGGSIVREATLGDGTPTGHPGYPGSLRLSEPGSGQVIVAQVLLSGVRSGVDHTLHLSSFAESAATPAITAALTDGSFGNIAGPVFDTATSGAWKRHTLTLTPSADADPAHLIVGITGAGTVLIDEIRLSETGAAPAVDPLILTRLQELGVTSLRYPGGTLADTFDWPASIGPLIDRGEVEAAFGDLQTPSLGLDEFLRLCEQAGTTPLVQLNVLDSPSQLADLVEYVNGDVSTPQGAIRGSNGHPAPYGVLWWEIGNEPTAAYQTGAQPDDTGADYAQLALGAAAAVRAVDPSIRLGGIGHTQFARADWLAAVPMLANWNAQVFTGPGALTSEVDFVHGHFYSYFGDDPDPEVRFRYLMAGGATLSMVQGDLDLLTGSLPMWLTEYHTIIENGGIQPQFLVDYQSGLVVADLLLTAAQRGFEGAHLHNLAEPVGFGALVHPGVWDLRPAGHAFAVLLAFAGERRVAATIVSPTETLVAGDGAIPSGITYERVAALVTRTSSGTARVALLNRTFDETFRVELLGAGSGVTGAVVHRYESADLFASNEITPGTVSVASQAVSVADPFTLDLAPHSLVRVDFQ